MYLIDTNTIIYGLKGERSAFDFIKNCLNNGTPLLVSTLSETEFLSFNAITDNEKREFDTFLTLCRIIDVDSSIARLAAEVRKTYGTKIADSIIAATALFFGAHLVTRNTRDFKKIKELSVIAI